MGIVVLDSRSRTVVFENEAAIGFFRGIPPRNYDALSSLLGGLKRGSGYSARPQPMDLTYGDKLLGYTVYNIAGDFFCVFVLDITERKQAEAHRSLLAAALESAHEAIIITNANGIIAWVNPALEGITCQSRQEILGKHIGVLAQGSGIKWNHFLKLLVKLRHFQTCNERITTKRQDGSVYVLDISALPVRAASGEVTNYVVLQRDVTEKARLESVAGAINTMDNIGYTLSGIRHEIGNPINSIKTTLSVLKANLSSFSRETVDLYIDRSLNEIARVEYLLRVFKNFNIFESPIVENIEIAPFWDTFLMLVTNDLAERSISIKSIVHPEAKWVRADPRALQQVLLNLLRNASDALAESEAPKIVLHIYKLQRQIKIDIIDCGCGISEEELGHLFKPFFTTKPHGTGLGLVLARKMLAKMDGLIEVTSEKNVGTITVVTLPAGSGAP